MLASLLGLRWCLPLISQAQAAWTTPTALAVCRRRCASSDRRTATSSSATGASRPTTTSKYDTKIFYFTKEGNAVPPNLPPANTLLQLVELDGKFKHLENAQRTWRLPRNNKR